MKLNHGILFLMLALLMLSNLSACGGSDDTQPDGDVEGSETEDITDGDTEEEAIEEDAEPEAKPTPAVIPYECGESAAANTLIDIDPQGVDTQIHGAVALDGTGLWVVYNLPDDNSYFDIYATRIGCDGETLVAPFKVNTSDFNDIDPALAISNDRLLIVWQSDNSQFPRNLDTYYRVYNIDGTPIMDADARLVMQKNGKSADFNAWMPQVAAQPNDGFAIIGSWAPDNLTVWQAFVQRIDKDGALDGDAFEVNSNALDSQVYPSLAALPAGDMHVAWTRERVEGEDIAKHALIPAGASAPTGPALDAIEGISTMSPSLAADPLQEGRVFMAVGAGDESHSSIYIKNAAEMNTSSANLEFGEASEYSHTPGVVVGPDGGALVWYRIISGIRNDVMTQGFEYDGQDFVAHGSAVQVNNEGEFGAPYAPAIAHVKDNIYFIVWSQGVSPAFRLKGRFVEL